ncbi:unnamed protein product [Ranitomeya imitator]|uniref:Btz domain-containing protein n=1 Tax=Ranitomeya imitator TaxID=111125 RepID=A0ABN9MDX9_9NEOB|nr:unnamed protein product [Ranitomeya imitator]
MRPGPSVTSRSHDRDVTEGPGRTASLEPDRRLQRRGDRDVRGCAPTQKAFSSHLSFVLGVVIITVNTKIKGVSSPQYQIDVVPSPGTTTLNCCKQRRVVNGQYRARGTRPWNRGAFSGSNNNNNNDFQKRNRDEEWDPEYTPKSKKYYLHDDREGENEEKWVNRGRGRANFARGRGRFLFRKPGTSPKWAHDKFSGEEGEIEEDESGAENKDEKGSMSLD